MPAVGRLWPSDDDDGDVLDGTGKQYGHLSTIAAFTLG